MEPQAAMVTRVIPAYTCRQVRVVAAGLGVSSAMAALAAMEEYRAAVVQAAARATMDLAPVLVARVLAAKFGLLNSSNLFPTRRTMGCAVLLNKPL
jgi:hypothetical protein